MLNRWKFILNLSLCLSVSACFSGNKDKPTAPSPSPTPIQLQNQLQEQDTDSSSKEPSIQDPQYTPAEPPTENRFTVDPKIIDDVRKPFIPDDDESVSENKRIPSKNKTEPRPARIPKKKNPEKVYSLVDVRKDFYDDTVTAKEFIQKFKNRNLVSDLNQIQIAVAFEKFSGKSQSIPFCPTSVTPRCNTLHLYVPDSAIGKGILSPLLIHLHGGGPATRTAELAAEIAERDLNLYKNWADKTGTIIATPSTDFEWQIETAFIVNDLVLAIQKEFPIHPDRIYLAGQSMGAIAIGKTFPFLTDKIAGFLSIIGKISENLVAQGGLFALLNAPYIQSNGLNDPVVVDNTPFIKSKLESGMMFHEFNHEQGHQISTEKLGQAMNTLFKHVRKPHPTEIYSNFIQMNQSEETIPCYDKNNPKIQYLLRRPKINQRKISKNHWLEIEGIPKISGDNTRSFWIHAKIVDNKVSIQSEDFEAMNPTELIVYLSKKTINFDEPILIEVNNDTVFYEKLSPSDQILIENAKRAKDPNFQFEQRVVIPLKPKRVSSLHKWKPIAA